MVHPCHPVCALSTPKVHNIFIDSATGRHGQASGTLHGEILGLSSADKSQVDISISVKELPLDETLSNAIGKNGKQLLQPLNLSGLAQRVTANVTNAPGQSLDYNVIATLEDVSINPTIFPYPISNGQGVLTIQPGRVILENISGKHGVAPVAASGQIFYGEEDLAFDLRVTGTDINFDREFFQALPGDVKKIWQRFSPAGQADMDMSLQFNMPGNEKELDYRLVMLAKDMQITYEAFPYTLRGITGQITAEPGKVVLDNCQMVDEQLVAKLSGTIVTEPGENPSQFDQHSAEFTLEAKNLPIDKEFLTALPGEFAPLAKRFKPGGTCDLNFRKLVVSSTSKTPTTLPADKVAESRDSFELKDWRIDGSARFNQAVIDIGLGDKRFSGQVTGWARQDKEGMELDAKAALDSVVVGRQQVRDLSARLRKGPKSPTIYIEDLIGKAHGGWLSGIAKIKLSEPLEYAISLSVKEVKLEDLFAAATSGNQGDKKKLNLKGLLTGDMRLIAIAGKPESRQATGRLQITDGQIYKLPVVMDLLHVLYLGVPGGSAFTEGELTYHLRGNELILSEIHLIGPTSIIGSGTVDMKTKELDMTFLADPYGRLRRIPNPADELLAGIARELVEYRVTGTLTKPKERVVTFRSLDDALRRLVTPGKK